MTVASLIRLTLPAAPRHRSHSLLRTYRFGRRIGLAPCTAFITALRA